MAKAAIEKAIASKEPLLVSLLTILETEWVLRSCAGLDKDAVIRTFILLLEAKDLVIENEEALELAIRNYENYAADFADCLMIARYQRIGCQAMMTFDAKAAKVPGCELLLPESS